MPITVDLLQFARVLCIILEHAFLQDSAALKYMFFNACIFYPISSLILLFINQSILLTEMISKMEIEILV